MEKIQIERIAKSRKVFTEPGKVIVKITSVNLFTPEDGTQPRFIVNTNAMGLAAAIELKKKLNAGTLEQADLNTNLTFNVFDANKVPTRGDSVYAVLGYVKARDGSQKLGIVSHSEMPVKAEANFSWEASEVEAEAANKTDAVVA